MATLTIPLPENPAAPQAYRLAVDCPRCGAPLGLRQNRQTGALFAGCSAYPQCTFTEPHDPRVQTLSTAVVQAVQALAQHMATVQAQAQQQVAVAQAAAQQQVAQALAQAQQQVAAAQTLAQQQVAAERAALGRTVRQLIALAHPDRWPDTPLAHELTVALVALRQTLRA